MDEMWERAVETALDGQNDVVATRTLTLDGAVKCLHGRLPAPDILEKFSNLQHLSLANIGLSSLEQFPRLRKLDKLVLSDNRIAGGLEHLVQAGLDSLRDLDLSNNRIQFLEDLSPLAELKVFSLDLYECPVTRVKDYRVKVFELVKGLVYLDKMDAEGNERPESDDEDDDDDDEDDREGEGEGDDEGEDDGDEEGYTEVDEDDDPGSGEIDGEEKEVGVSNGSGSGGNEAGIVDLDEDEESDTDEEVTETEGETRRENGVYNNGVANGFRVVGMLDDGEDDEEEDDESGEEIDEDDGEEDDEVVEVHDVLDSSDDDEDDDDDDEVEEVDDDDDVDIAVPETTGRLVSTDGEIDGHEQGEDEDGDDDDGETGEEEVGVEDESNTDDDDGDDEEEDGEEGYLVQRVRQSTDESEESDMEAGVDGEGVEIEEDEDDDLGEGQVMAPSSTCQPKRKRDDGGVDEDDEDDVDRPSSKKHH